MLDLVHLVGINVLTERLTNDSVSGGIILPEQTNKLEKGRVVKKGPGFLVPFPAENAQFEDIAAIIGETKDKAKFIPLDIEVNDIVYFVKEAGESVFINQRQYVIVPYIAIKLFIRKEREH